MFPQASKSLHFAAWVRCISLLPEQRQLSRGVVEELNVLTRHRDLARQKYKMAGGESAFARLESARALDTLILSLQDKMAKNRSPAGLSPNGSVGEGAADVSSDALFGGGRATGDGSHATNLEGGVQGMSGVSSLIDSMLAQGRAGSEIDYESLMVLSQSLETRGTD